MSEKFPRDIENLIEEQPPKEEKKEGKEKEIYRFELDPEKNIDIVIKEKGQIKPEMLKEVELMAKHLDYGPVQVLIEKNGKVVEDFAERSPVGFYCCRESRKSGGRWGYL